MGRKHPQRPSYIPINGDGMLLRLTGRRPDDDGADGSTGQGPRGRPERRPPSSFDMSALEGETLAELRAAPHRATDLHAAKIAAYRRRLVGTHDDERSEAVAGLRAIDRALAAFQAGTETP
jgi:hypothetical protein